MSVSKLKIQSIRETSLDFIDVNICHLVKKILFIVIQIEVCYFFGNPGNNT